MRPLKRLRLEWGASQRVPPLEAVPDGALDRALAVHGHSLVSLESDLFRGVRPSSLASLGRLTRLESLKLRGFACMAAEAVITPWPEGVLPAGLSRLTALEVEDICDCGCSADLPWSCEIFPCLEELRMEVGFAERRRRCCGVPEGTPVAATQLPQQRTHACLDQRRTSSQTIPGLCCPL
jgi:hypothetical protein